MPQQREIYEKPVQKQKTENHQIRDRGNKERASHIEEWNFVEEAKQVCLID